MAARTALESFLNKARQRHLINLLLAQTSLASSIAAAGFIVLLIVGTQILDWYWPVLLLAAGLAIGVYRGRKEVLPQYELAQRIDGRLELQDGLSTAFFFRHLSGAAPGTLPVLERKITEAVSSESALRRGVPILLPKSAYALASLVLIAGGVFVFRYGITRSLSLQAPIARMDFAAFQDEPILQAEVQKKSAVQVHLEKQLEQMGLSLEQLDSEADGGERTTDRTGTVSSPDGNETLSVPERARKGAASPDSVDQGEEGANSESGERASAGEGENQSTEDNPASAQKGSSETPKAAPKMASNDGSKLMDKVRDAVANLMSKMKPQPKGSEGQQMASNNQGNAQNRTQQNPSQKGLQGQGRSQSEGQPNPDAEGDQQGEPSDQAQGSQSQAGDKSTDRPGNPDAKSGVGKQDGDKDIKEAEQLAAMGKISELLGKRAAQISGEMTVEVPSGKQQLKTSYTQKRALHADAGGEVNREEIPLIYQPYVQRYFEEVRKSSADKARN